MNGESNGSVDEPTLPMEAAESSKPETLADTNEDECLNNDQSLQKSIVNEELIIHEAKIEDNISENISDDKTNGKDIENVPDTETQPSQNIINGEMQDVLENNKDENSIGNPCTKESHEIVSNNNHETESSQVKKSNEIQEDSLNEVDEGLQLTEKNLNGFESNHNSDNESCQYLDDPMEDPISTGENNEKEEQECNEKIDSKENEEGTKPGSFEIVAINRYHSSEENSSDCPGSEEELRAQDTVSLTSDEDASSDNENNKSNDVIIIDNDHTDNQNGNNKSPEIHEIGSDISDNDDCVLTAVEKLPKTPKKKKNVTTPPNAELRRSSRAIKRKRYSEVQEVDGSDDEVEEVVLEDGNISQAWKINKDGQSKPKILKLSSSSTIGSNTTKTTKQAKSKTTQNKDGILIIDALKNRLPAAKSSTTILNQNLCQSIAARGISVTPISAKSIETKTTSTQATQSLQITPVAPILPTLTDDMFVVEAPSFIVPYVYEKPAMVPFKEFVEKWGKEIEEERAKEIKEALEKKLAEKAKRQQERQEKKERGEEVEESEEELTPEEIEKKKAEKAERKERRRRKKEEDDASWDGASSEESDDDSLSEDDSQSTFKEKAVIDEMPTLPTKTDSYFDLSLGKFFIDIGSNLVQEYVQSDLLHQENRKLRRENRTGHDTKKRKASIAQLTKNLELSRKTNESFKFEQKKCKFCTFKTESALALAFHMETPHMKNNMYICNFCSIELQNAHNILFHMEKTHGVKGRLERALAPHQCSNCPFEDQGKGKLGRHLIACAKKFKPETNLAPPIEWEHPAKIPKLPRARAPAPYQVSHFGRNHVDGVGSSVRIPISTVPQFRPRAAPAPLPVHIRPTGLVIRPATPQNVSNAANAKKPNHSYIISTAPRQAGPIQPINSANAKGVVMCEICDGYIKDLEQLRNHMQWIHRIKIHPKMIYNRPPLNCQKCQFRFFTDQGLERHLLGSHGLVTSAIQEAANKGKDAGRCPVCGRAYQRKLLAHVSRDHNLVLKPAHLSYKCTVCSATFGMYRQFENHVYSAHSVVAKKVIDKKTAPAAKPSGNEAAQPLNANEDEAVIPQPPKVAAVAKGK